MNSSFKMLVDCNVWVDSYMPPRSGHEESLAFINDAIASDAVLLYGASKLETIFYIMRAETKRVIRMSKGELSEADAGFALRYAWGCIDNMCDISVAVGLDDSDLWLARQYRAYHGDLEDNILMAAAKRSGADYLVTWDEHLLRDASPVVRTVTPTTARIVLREQV